MVGAIVIFISEGRNVSCQKRKKRINILYTELAVYCTLEGEG
jgi:hypothetical protein